MPPFVCACGQTVDAPPGDAACPACGAVVVIPAEKIRFACACGARLGAPAKLIGKSISCPGCGQEATVPAASEAPAPSRGTGTRVVSRSAGTAAIAAPARPRKPAPPDDPRWMTWTRYGLAVALIPLLLSILLPDPDVESRVRHMVEQDPSLAKVLQTDDEEQLFHALPGERIEGAAFGRFTWIHWPMAAISACVFWLFILVAWPMGTATSKQLWLLGVFTGTIGIVLLLAIQWFALHFRGIVIPRSIVGIFLLVVQFIGFSYRAALDPSNGFFLSMLGFTMGVGLCEEACKTLPLIFLVRGGKALDARGLALLGLATGIGFGVSEGITYSSTYYNGISGSWIYVVRFVSCVALHAVWSASSALILWRSQADVEAIDSWHDWFIPVIKVVGISMVLHGLYDTCLKREMEIAAFLSAVASFVWFSWLYERTVRAERQMSSSLAS